MLALKGIKMPQNCSECSFKANDYVCGLLDCAFSCNHFTERNYNCPLVEIVTCKECKHWKDSDGVYRRGIGAESKCPINTKEVFEGNFYCADGERRE